MRKPFILFVLLQIVKSRQTLKAKTTRLHIESHISLRYAETRVQSEMQNPDSSAQEITFSMILPETAFISNFSMILKDAETVGKVMEKQEALNEYNEAKRIGISSGLVRKERFSNKFSISTNVEAKESVVFRLTYEELLERCDKKYRHNINMFSHGDVDNVTIEIFLNESRPLSYLNVTEVKNTNDITAFLPVKDAEMTWERGSPEAHILYQPTEDKMKGQLSIEYDVVREEGDHEIQVIDGYFVHFFTDDKLQPLPKHVVFILDVSGSMGGTRIIQLKEAMLKILEDMEDMDYFSIITFSTLTTTWRHQYFHKGDNKDQLSEIGVFKATEQNRRLAKIYVNGLRPLGSTNINSALLKGMDTVRQTKQSGLLADNITPMIWFLTDGEATTGETRGEVIKENVKTNNHHNVPILGLAFGTASDFELIRDISGQTDSLARRIYEGSDAAIQLEDFYNIIKSPILSNVNFKYVGNSVKNSSLSQTLKYQMYSGGEYVIVGQLTNSEDDIELRVRGHARTGQYQKRVHICPRCQTDSLPTRSKAQNFMKKLYAFKNIQQLMKSDSKAAQARAKELSLENNFVTDLTSLVIPNDREEKVRLASTGYHDIDYDVGMSYSPSSSLMTFSSPPRPGSTLSRVSSRMFSMPHRNSLPVPKYASRAQGGARGRTSVRKAARRGVLKGRGSMPFVTSTEKSNSTSFSQQNCSITLYSEEYHTGDTLQLTGNVPDLSLRDFEDRLVSLEVDGSCIWQIFDGKHFTGDTKQVSAAEDYRRRSNVGNFYLNAKSIRKL